MKINVTRDNVVIDKNSIKPHENEYNITQCHFTFDDFIDSFQVKRVIFTVESTGEMYENDILDYECEIPSNVLEHEYETIRVGVYGYNIEENEELINRFSPSYDTFVVPTGSYKEGALSPEPITPSQYDIYSSKLQEGLDKVDEALEEVSNVNISAEQLDDGASVTITDRNGEDKTVTIHDGYTPVKGVDYFTTSEIEEIENTVKTDVINELDFDNTVNDIKQDIQDLNTNKASKTELEQEITARELADTNLQGQIDAISSSKDVVDIVGTYSDLQNYDTSTLTEEDVIKVLDDSTHNDAMSYYRWSNNTWNYIGSEGPFYTKSETDDRLNTKQAKIDSEHKLSSDLVDDTNQTHKFTSTNEKNTWNAKYDKPSNGIPKSDLVASVQESLNKADTAIQDVSDKEDKSNKVTEINSSSTDTQYPSAKCVYDSQEEQNEHIAELEMLYNAFPTVSDEDTTIQLDNTAKVKFREIDLKGNTSQVVIPEEQGTSVSNTSIYVSDVNTDKESSIEMSGNTYQETTTGKNILPQDKYIASQTINGITYTNNGDGTFDLNGTATANTSLRIIDVGIFNLESGQRYYLYSSVAYNSTTFNMSIVTTESGTQKFLIANSNYTPSTTPTNSRLQFYIASGNTVNVQNVKLMLVKGADDTSYEPFTNGASPNPDYPQNIEVVTGTNNIEVCGKNLFDKDSEDVGHVYSSTGSYGITALWSTSDWIKASDYITISASTTGSINMLLSEFDNSKTFIQRTQQEGTSKTYNLNTNTKYVRLSYKNDIGITNIQIERGSTATTYEAYQGTTYPVNLGDIELCKIDTYQDRIYKQNDKWYLEKNVDKVILNGSETWSKSANRFVSGKVASVIKPTSSNDEIAKIFSDKFVGVTINNTIQSQPLNGIAIAASGNLVIYYDAVINFTYGEFRDWISTHNTAVYYVLATTTTTEITDTTLVNQLNALYNATIYPITNINTDTSNLLPYIDLHYNFVTPSPSPSRPSVVNVVKGNNTLTICGKNLIGLGTQLNGYRDISTNKFQTNANAIGYYFRTNQLPDTITFTGTNSNRSNVSYYNEIPALNVVSTDYSNSNSTPRTIAVDKTYPYIHIQFSYNQAVSDIQVESGSSSTTFEEYKSQTYPINLGDMELCKIGTYQDYIYESNGNWYFRKNINKITLNGSEENWSSIVHSGDYYRLALTIDDAYDFGSTRNTNLYCDMFKAFTTTNYNIVFFSNKSAYFYLPQWMTTKEEFMSFLSTNNSLFYYVLATPTDTQITDATLIAQLNNIKKAYSYDTQTNISQTNADKPFIIYAEAIRSLKDVFE